MVPAMMFEELGNQRGGECHRLGGVLSIGSCETEELAGFG